MLRAFSMELQFVAFGTQFFGDCLEAASAWLAVTISLWSAVHAASGAFVFWALFRAQHSAKLQVWNLAH